MGDDPGVGAVTESKGGARSEVVPRMDPTSGAVPLSIFAADGKGAREGSVGEEAASSDLEDDAAAFADEGIMVSPWDMTSARKGFSITNFFDALVLCWCSSLARWSLDNCLSLKLCASGSCKKNGEPSSTTTSPDAR